MGSVYRLILLIKIALITYREKNKRNVDQRKHEKEIETLVRYFSLNPHVLPALNIIVEVLIF